jgi:hypothetical protein
MRECERVSTFPDYIQNVNNQLKEHSHANHIHIPNRFTPTIHLDRDKIRMKLSKTKNVVILGSLEKSLPILVFVLVIHKLVLHA